MVNQEAKKKIEERLGEEVYWTEHENPENKVDDYPLHYKLKLLRALISIVFFWIITIASFFYDFSPWMRGLQFFTLFFMLYCMKNTDMY